MIVDAGVAKADGDWAPLRGLLPFLADDALAGAPLVFHALGLAEWLWVTRFCPRCGEPLHPRSSAHELTCDNGHTQFPRTDPAVIMVVTHGEPGSEDERCLLGRGATWPEGRYSTLAGFCEPGRPSRTPYAVRCVRSPASWSGTSSTSATSPGRCPPA